MTALTFHPLANLFPLMSEAEFAGLVADIGEHGQHEPILTWGGQIIDGRNRYNACRQLGIKPTIFAWNGREDELLPFIVSLNLHRRHLNESQRAMVAAKLADMQEGRPRKDETRPIGLVSSDSASVLLNISKKSIGRAAHVLRNAAPAVISAVEQGHLPVSAAANLTAAPVAFQSAVAERVVAGIRPQEAMRQVKAEQIAVQPVAGPCTKYRVIYADPPWSYGNTQPDYHPEQRDHYPVMSLADICALPVRQWVEDDAVLFLWVTAPILEESFQVIHAWGFAYKTCFVWDKVKHNMGHYSSVRHELLLLATRGSCQPDVRRLFDSVLSIERTDHSTKPDEFRHIIDTIYPHGRRIELFARRRVEGWDAYGNQL